MAYSRNVSAVFRRKRMSSDDIIVTMSVIMRQIILSISMKMLSKQYPYIVLCLFYFHRSNLTP